MKDRTTYAVLAIFLGSLGAHRFYIGQPAIALLYVLFCWTGVPLIVGVIEGIVTIVKPKEWFDDYAARVQAKNAAAAEKRRQAAEAKRQALVDKYGERWVDMILAKQIAEDMPAAAVVAAWGKPALIKEDRGPRGVKHKYYYGAYRNSKKSISYRKEVRLEDGRVTGWKDL